MSNQWYLYFSKIFTEKLSLGISWYKNFPVTALKFFPNLSTFWPKKYQKRIFKQIWLKFQNKTKNISLSKFDILSKDFQRIKFWTVFIAKSFSVQIFGHNVALKKKNHKKIFLIKSISDNILFLSVLL